LKGEKHDMDMKTTAVADGGLLTVEEAAARMRVSKDWFLRYCRKHKPAWFRKLGHRTVRVAPEAFQAWLTTGRRGR